MRTHHILIGLLAGLIVGCTLNPGTEQGSQISSKASVRHQPATGSKRALALIPDSGQLTLPDRSRTVERRGNVAWYPVNLSEEHALHAIGGVLTVATPQGRNVRLQYERHVEHGDGNWTWIGREAGGTPGREAIITFGDRAAFGSIPDGSRPPLALTVSQRGAWLIESTGHAGAAGRKGEEDFIVPDAIPLELQAAVPAAVVSAPLASGASNALAAAPEAATIDVVLGYTVGFAQRLGGQSEAVTRLVHLIDVANQAFANSQVDAALRLAGTVQVDYPDNTLNRTTLFELSGVSCQSAPGGQLPNGGVACSYVGQPAALQPLIAARNQKKADLVALVRKFESPESGSCGLAWLLGNGQTAIDRSSANFGLAVIGDSSGSQFPDPDTGATCRDETLIHELGHTMGLQHDRDTAAGSDDSDNNGNTLDPEEFGRFPYAFGYRTGTSAGNFMDLMAVRDGTQTALRLFSNPNISSCNGFACGVADVADAARALRQTVPVVAAFRDANGGIRRIRNDINGDGKSDLVLWNGSLGYLAYWLMDGPVYSGSRNQLIGTAFAPWPAGQSTGSGRWDMLMRRTSDSTLFSYQSQAQGLVPNVIGQYDPAWTVVGQGDIDGDGKDDIFWRHPALGYFAYWLMDGPVYKGGQTYQPPPSYLIAAIEDFNADGRVDIVWNDPGARQMSIWLSVGSGFTVEQIGQYGPDWRLVGAADVTGDGKADLLWRNATNTFLAFWRMDGAVYLGSDARPTATDLELRAIGDYNGDGLADLVWERPSDRRLTMWLGDGVNFGEYNLGQRGADWTIVP